MKDAVQGESITSSIALEAERDLVGEFLNRYRDSSFRIAMRIVGDADVAEDIAQESLIRAFRSWDRFSIADSQSAWVRRIVVRCALNSLERSPRHLQIPESTEQKGGTEESLMVRSVLEDLEPDHRVILGLVTGEGLSYREVADILEIPIGTVGSRVHAAKHAFRNAWEGVR